MVDLMMWLVIAALLLAAALQGIGFYQRAAWSYQLKTDTESMRTYMEGYYSTNNVYPDKAIANVAIANGSLSLSGSNIISHIYIPSTAEWQLRVCSVPLRDATGNADGSAARIYRSDTALYDKATC